MTFTTYLKETFIYRAVQEVLSHIDFLGRNLECFVRTVPATEFCEYPIVLCRAVECVWLAVVVQ